MSKSRIWLVALAMLPALCFADTGKISIKNPWARETLPATTTGVIYLTLENHSDQAIAIDAVSTPVARKAEVHKHVMADGMMSMEKVDHLQIAAGTSAIFKPGSLHLMLFDIKQPLKVGQSVSVAIQLDNGQTLSFDAPVKPIVKR